jgi:predicted NBD/HSP70 family sugar kinase
VVCALGLQVDVDHISACVVDLTGGVRVRHRSVGDNRRLRPGAVLARLRRVASAVLEKADATGLRCIGGGLAVPGLVDPRSGAVLVAPNLGWTDVALPSLRVDVTVDNEANLGALAELRHGAARDLSSFVYVSGGIGVGAGIVLDGRVARGAHGFAGELGHVVVDPDGKRCACGARGCLETVVGAGRRARTADVAAALAVALRSVVHVIDPEAIVLGGSFATTSAGLATAVAERLDTTTLGARWARSDVRLSALGPDAALVGAATVALDAVVADPTTVPLPSARESA